jgi:hypothetical protein
VLLCLLGGFALYFLLRFLWQKTQTVFAGKAVIWLWPAILAGGLFCLLLLFIGFSKLGAETGEAVFAQERAEDFASYPIVKVWLEGKEDERAKEWAKGCYRLLLRDKENLYIFPGAATSRGQRVTDIIPNSRVAAVRVLSSYQMTDECR